MMTTPFEERYLQLQEKIEAALTRSQRTDNHIEVIAVTKHVSIEKIQEAYTLGVRSFAENRIQEALSKQLLLPKDIAWHFIGALQSNKVPKLFGKFSLIHSVDRLDIAEKFSKYSSQSMTPTRLLLEINTSNERQKHGIAVADVPTAFESLLKLPCIEVKGLMTMAPKILTHAQEEITNVRRCFQSLYKLKVELERKFHLPTPLELSMGMSQDFEYAIEEGATMLRIGSFLFAE